MSQLGIPRDYVTTGCLALVGFIAFYFFSAWLFLRFIPVQITFTKQVQSNEREEGAAEAVARAKSAELRTPTEIMIRMHDLRLWIDKKSLWRKSTVHILQGVTVDFEPGKLNVIMGPSGFLSYVKKLTIGSGKSSLLNILCRRLHGSLTSRYHYSGELFFNNSVPSDAVIRALTSYVVQDDMALLPSLTVRETLHFAAIIRLPPHMTKSQNSPEQSKSFLNLAYVTVQIPSSGANSSRGSQEERNGEYPLRFKSLPIQRF